MVLEFFRIVPQAPDPVRADAAALGTISLRAYRYCEALRQASSLGWHVFPPRAVSLRWDGFDIGVSLDDGPFQSGGIDAMPFPELDSAFNAHAAPSCIGLAPPWITVLPEPGIVQIWSGLFAKTVPGWSLLVRSPANLPSAGNYEAFEGIVDSDCWFGPLFINLRLTRTDVCIRLNPEWPIAMVVPIQRSTTHAALAEVDIHELSSMTQNDWEMYERSVTRGGTKPLGQYAIDARRRQAAEAVLYEQKRVCPRSSINAL